MTDSFVTQCPHCQTSFRVSHAQLSVARGMVRCGSCLQVFNAAKQLLEKSAQALTSTAAPTSAPAQSDPQPAIIAPHSVTVAQPAPPPARQADHTVDLDSLDLDDLDVELARLEQREIQLPESFGRAQPSKEHEVESFSARRDEPDVAPEDWNPALSHDDINRLPELRAEVVEERGDPLESDARQEPIVGEASDPDDHRTEPSLSMASDAVDDERYPSEHVRATENAQSAAPAERLSALDDEDDHPSARHEIDEDDGPSLGKGKRSEPGLRDQALLDLMDDPLQLSWQKPKPRWGRRLLWLALALIALGALAGQYVWYHFDELARQDQYRPWFQDICPQVGCKVPSKVDIKLLKSSNLVVRSHPEFQGALVVDAIIYNRASFSQPFPLLELRFADTNGQLIASRRFKPGEYLSGELAGKDEMPPQTPIHIALDILDPGPKAVNYSLSFRSPE
ncbi:MULTISPECIES: DUF3426 domain-containing protein [unclassified Pseudomonas]|uniref:DUF3426 domain-containing protein n=1 Tax=unclassified Pseudomonas TaxID=196821 RepID=UPI000D37250E|nr:MULTISPECIES: DUF3426 domain-containing protein [unclassified Pseudomonas]RAU39819.1 DUF3426 domain-containing protein [Pseudomonas sp. RIT 409]RAU53463.1 DUF3426 domain-containing protein [Pseudomonas sp. RIT 412]